MTILSSIYERTLGRVLPVHRECNPAGPISKKRKHREESEDHKESILGRRKRDDSAEDNESIQKRRRVGQDRFAPIVDGETFESTAIEAPSGTHLDTEREVTRILMPPPPLTPVKSRPFSNEIGAHNSRTSMDVDSVSLLSLGPKVAQPRPSDDIMNDYDMEKARRHAAATTLPPNSGVWERGEKELFFHLSLRGFEPLLPKDWMQDFRTLPISLYESDAGDEQPLVQVYNAKGDFRAIRELRELFDLGKNVRDKVLSSPGIRKEIIIEKATKKYISWALNDAGIKIPSSSRSTSTALPIHVIVRLKARQSTTDCLMEMKKKLHHLRVQHCRARNIHVSVERDQASCESPGSEEETWVAEDSDEDLPVLYGIMIYKSIFATFTLNSRTPAPKFVSPWASVRNDQQPSPAMTESIYGNPIESVASTEANERIKKSIMRQEMEELGDTEDDSASDPRFISDFDFSDAAKDVWNALVIVIVAMQIRNDMLLLEARKNHDSLEDIRAGIETNSIMEIDDDPDA